jgi:hypothetical protein
VLKQVRFISWIRASGLQIRANRGEYYRCFPTLPGLNMKIQDNTPNSYLTISIRFQYVSDISAEISVSDADLGVSVKEFWLSDVDFSNDHWDSRLSIKEFNLALDVLALFYRYSDFLCVLIRQSYFVNAPRNSAKYC